MHCTTAEFITSASSEKLEEQDTIMANNPGPKPNLDRYVVIHVATTCDEHGVFVTKDSAEVIELGWILLDAKSAEEVSTVQSYS